MDIVEFFKEPLEAAIRRAREVRKANQAGLIAAVATLASTGSILLLTGEAPDPEAAEEAGRLIGETASDMLAAFLMAATAGIVAQVRVYWSPNESGSE